METGDWLTSSRWEFLRWLTFTWFQCHAPRTGRRMPFEIVSRKFFAADGTSCEATRAYYFWRGSVSPWSLDVRTSKKGSYCELLFPSAWHPAFTAIDVWLQVMLLRPWFFIVDEHWALPPLWWLPWILDCFTSHESKITMSFVRRRDDPLGIITFGAQCPLPLTWVLKEPSYLLGS